MEKSFEAKNEKANMPLNACRSALTFREPSKDFLDTGSSPRTGTKMRSTKFLGLSLGLVQPDLPIVLKIALIADDDDGHFVSKLRPQLLHPLLHSLE